MRSIQKYLYTQSFAVVFFIFLNQTYSQTLIPYLDHGKYGYSDLTGTIKITPEFDQADFFTVDGVANVRKGLYWSMITTSGKVLFPYDSKNQIELQTVFSSDTIEWHRNGHGTDTIHHLRIQRLTDETYRILNLKYFYVSPIYHRYTIVSNPHWEGSVNVTFQQGIFFAQISDTLYHVLNTNAENIFTSHTPPEQWKDSLVTAKEGKQIIGINLKSKEKFTLPFKFLHQIIRSDLFVVADWRKGINMSANPNLSRMIKGVVDQKGNMILEMKYDRLEGYLPLLIGSLQKDEAYFINLKGERLDSNMYKKIWRIKDDHFEAQLSDSKYILLDHLLHRVTNESYDSIYEWKMGAFAFQIDSSTEFWDEHFKPLVRTHANEIWGPSPRGFYKIIRNGKYGIINSRGEEIIPPIYDACFEWDFQPFFKVYLNGKQGLIRTDGTIAFEPVYDDIGYHSEYNTKLITTGINGYYTYYDPQLDFVIDSMKDSSLGIRSMYTQRMAGMYQILDMYGKPIGMPVIKFIYSMVDSDSTNLALLYVGDLIYVMRPDGSMVTNDAIVLDHDFDKISQDDGLYGVRVGEKEGVINYKSEWVIVPELQKVIGVNSKYIIIEREGKNYMYHIDGSRADIEPFSRIYYNRKQLNWKVERNNKFGFINSHTGKIIVPLIYDQASMYQGKYVVVISGLSDGHKKSYLIDSLGKNILAVPYDSLYPLNNAELKNYFVALSKEKKGVIDINGRVIVPVSFEKIESFADTTFFKVLLKDSISSIVNRSGRQVFTGLELPKSDSYIRLPGQKYLFYLEHKSIIVDREGLTIKTLESDDIKLIPDQPGKVPLLKVREKGQTYIMNGKTLMEYRKSG